MLHDVVALLKWCELIKFIFRHNFMDTTFCFQYFLLFIVISASGQLSYNGFFTTVLILKDIQYVSPSPMLHATTGNVTSLKIFTSFITHRSQSRKVWTGPSLDGTMFDGPSFEGAKLLRTSAPVILYWAILSCWRHPLILISNNQTLISTIDKTHQWVITGFCKRKFRLTR